MDIVIKQLDDPVATYSTKSRQTRLRLLEMDICQYSLRRFIIVVRVGVQGVESLKGDCRFIPADWGS